MFDVFMPVLRLMTPIFGVERRSGSRSNLVAIFPVYLMGGTSLWLDWDAFYGRVVTFDVKLQQYLMHQNF